jgi:DNA-binding transcriptional ArsR family regulator
MVEKTPEQLDAIFHGLANATRRDILLQVARRERTVNELAEQYEMTLQAVSKHLRVLIDAGLVAQSREGRIRRCRINYPPLQSAANVLDEYRNFWESQFDSIEAFIQRAKGQSNDNDE